MMKTTRATRKHLREAAKFGNVGDILGPAVGDALDDLEALKTVVERLLKASSRVAVLQPAAHAKDAEEAKRYEEFYGAIHAATETLTVSSPEAEPTA